LAAIVRDVPDNEKVAGEAEAADQVEFEVQLLEHLCAEVGIPRSRSGEGHCAQERIHRFARGHRVFRKFVTEIFESEFEAFGHKRRVFDGFRQVGEEVLHLPGGFEMSLGVDA
jgi:hypothetical protein